MTHASGRQYVSAHCKCCIVLCGYQGTSAERSRRTQQRLHERPTASGSLASPSMSLCSQNDHLSSQRMGAMPPQEAPRPSGRGARGGGCSTGRRPCGEAASLCGTPPAHQRDQVRHTLLPPNFSHLECTWLAAAQKNRLLQFVLAVCLLVKTCCTAHQQLPGCMTPCSCNVLRPCHAYSLQHKQLWQLGSGFRVQVIELGGSSVQHNDLQTFSQNTQLTNHLHRCKDTICPAAPAQHFHLGTMFYITQAQACIITQTRNAARLCPVSKAVQAQVV